jgi:pentose-5-phosphate-3-epimerase
LEYSEFRFARSTINEKTIDRIKHLRHKYLDHVISIDGGVNLDNAQALVSAGANRLVVGSALWQGNSVVENLEEFSKIQ